jgi:hypothetical protein
MKLSKCSRGLSVAGIAVGAIVGVLVWKAFDIETRLAQVGISPLPPLFVATSPAPPVSQARLSASFN